MHCSLPDSSVHGILQARRLEWVAIPPPGDLPDPGIEPILLMSPALACGFFTPHATWEAHVVCVCVQHIYIRSMCVCIYIYIYTYTHTHTHTHIKSTSKNICMCIFTCIHKHISWEWNILGVDSPVLVKYSCSLANIMKDTLRKSHPAELLSKSRIVEMIWVSKCLSF